MLHGRRRIEEEETIDVPSGDDADATGAPADYLPAASEAGP
jgi:hypothetical protein